MTKPRLIRKYANRRLYDTVRSRYVNLKDVCALIAEGNTIQVEEQASGKDITNSILLQIIGTLDRSSGALLTSDLLMDLIRTAVSNQDPALPEKIRQACNSVLPVHH
jgi:polyhydroxyalkanoate synthesis repressor PhaR